MNKEQYFKFAEETFNKCLELQKLKNQDYGGKDDNVFANFKAVKELGIKVEHGFLTRIMDKIKRIASFVNNGDLLIKDESVEDTLIDLINYSCLFLGSIKESKQTIDDAAKIISKHIENNIDKLIIEGNIPDIGTISNVEDEIVPIGKVQNLFILTKDQLEKGIEAVNEYSPSHYALQYLLPCKLYLKALHKSYNKLYDKAKKGAE